MFNLWALLFERGLITSEVNNSQIGVRKSKLCGGYIDECIRVGINLWYYFWCYACGSQVYRFKKKEIDKCIIQNLHDLKLL